MPLPVPPDLEQALADVPAARRGFDALPPEGKDRWIAWVQRARLGQSRRRRIAHAIAALGAPPRRVATGEEVYEELGPPRPLIWPWLLALALLLLVAALLVWLLVYRDNGDKSRNNVVVEKAAVPNVVGERQAQAVKRVQAAHLTPVTQRRRSAEPAGVVVDQQPNGGETVKGGTVVKLVVSQGPPKLAVPEVTGLAAADAVTKLQDAKLGAKLVEIASPKTPGTVVRQKPAAGEEAPQGTTVTLSVSKGGGQVTVPAVVGETAAQASSDLQAAGLKASTVSVASGQRRGTVVSQGPGGGARGAKGAAVELKVSKGPATTTSTAATTSAAPTTTQGTTTRQTTTQQTTTTQASQNATVPSLTGQGLASALGALERAGLRAVVKYQSSQAPLGQVRGQNPAAGESVPRGSRVQVNVSEGPNPGNPTPVPDETGQDQQTATSELQDAGFKVIVIQRSGTGQPAGTVVEQQPAAGTSISSGDYVAIYVSR